MSTSTNTDAIKEMYVKTHYLVIAQIGRMIIDIEAVIIRDPRAGIMMGSMGELLREQQRMYQIEFERVIKDHDITTMDRFIQRAIEQEKSQNNREFDYLFPSGR